MTPTRERPRVGATCIGGVLVVTALAPCCRWYQRYKAAHRGGWPRYI